jgi:hypothetical protein
MRTAVTSVEKKSVVTTVPSGIHCVHCRDSLSIFPLETTVLCTVLMEIFNKFDMRFTAQGMAEI